MRKQFSNVRVVQLRGKKKHKLLLMVYSIFFTYRMSGGKKKEGYVQGRKILIFCHALKLCPSPILCHYDCTYRLCGIAVVLWINYM